MKKCILTLALALLLLCAGLAVPARAATDPFQITWLSTNEKPVCYNRGLNWLTLWDITSYNFTVLDLTTNARIEEYDYVCPFSEGLAMVEKGGKCGFIDQIGAVAIPLEYDDADSFSDGLAMVEKDGKYGYIDQAGAMMVIPLEEYAESGPFSEGLAWVLKRDTDGNLKSGYIDKTGAVVIPLEYDGCGFFSDGLAVVVKQDADGNRKEGYIDQTGAMVVPVEYDEVGEVKDGLCYVKKGASYGIFHSLYWTPEEDGGSKGGFPVVPVAVAVVVIVVAALAVALVLVKRRGKLNKEAVTAAASKVSETAATAAAKATEGVARARQAVHERGGITCSCGMVNPPDAKFCSGYGKPLGGKEGESHEAE